MTESIESTTAPELARLRAPANAAGISHLGVQYTPDARREVQLPFEAAQIAVLAGYTLIVPPPAVEGAAP